MNKNPDIDGQKNLHICAFLLTSLAEGDMFTKPESLWREKEKEKEGRLWPAFNCSQIWN